MVMPGVSVCGLHQPPLSIGSRLGGRPRPRGPIGGREFHVHAKTLQEVTRTGRPFDKGAVYTLLTNRVYLGEAVHKGQSYPGEHAAIVLRDVWDRVHDLLRESPRSHAARSRAQTSALLRGLLFGPEGRTLSPTRGDPALVKALARAFRWKRMMDGGRYGSINQLAAAEKINESYVSRVLRLILLAPEIVEVILDGRQSRGEVASVDEGVSGVVEWGQQAFLATCTASLRSRLNTSSPN